MATVITIDIREYFRSHQKKPRGKGLWLFRVGNQELQYNGNYSLARDCAVRAAIRENKTYVVVLP